MLEGTHKARKRVEVVLTPDDVLGMFEVGLEMLARHFQFEATNVDGGVQITIAGLQRINEPDGSWHLGSPQINIKTD
jgi:hypothetical protein